MTVLACDGDIIAYRIAAGCAEENGATCMDVIDATLNTIMLETGATKMRIYLSGADNFRYGVAKTKPYKGNRDRSKTPDFLLMCRAYLIKEYKAFVVNGYEADDAIASDMMQNGAIHCGQDKDLFQIPGKHYNYVKKKMISVTDKEAILFLCRQILTGDSADNIPGLPGVGEKTAAKVIKDAETAVVDTIDMYCTVLRKNIPDFSVHDYFIEQSRLVTLITDLNLFDLITYQGESKGLNI